MKRIAIIIPTLGRPERLAGIVANIRETTAYDHRIVFVLEEDDTPSREAVLGLTIEPHSDVVAVRNTHSRTYAGAIRTAYEASREPYLFCGADDLRFHVGWDTAAFMVMHNPVDEFVQVVGTNDLLNPYVALGIHSTHSLVDRRYLDEVGGVIDEGPGSFLHEGYGHNYVDTEFIGTAKMRSVFRPCLASVVEHLHQSAGRMAHDATHAKAERTYGADAELYDERRSLWLAIGR